jgi:hypothetical protein
MKLKNLLLILLICSGIVSIAQKNTVDKIDQFMSEKYPATEPGASILVAKDGKVILKRVTDWLV